MIQAIEVFPGWLSHQGLRMGDLIAACNLLEHIRKEVNLPDLRFHIPSESLYPAEHCAQFHDWLVCNTNYLSVMPDQLVTIEPINGTDPTYPTLINLWNIRKDVLERKQSVMDIDDLVKLPGPQEKQNKIVICPLMDANYNQDRNWSIEYLDRLINAFPQYSNTDYILVSKEPIKGFDPRHFQYSHDFYDNLEHVQTCHVYIGGDTGISHFAGALENQPRCEFKYPSTTYGTTLPFYWKTLGDVTYY